jgi:hypothetical protein
LDLDSPARSSGEPRCWSRPRSPGSWSKSRRKAVSRGQSTRTGGALPLARSVASVVGDACCVREWRYVAPRQFPVVGRCGRFAAGVLEIAASRPSAARGPPSAGPTPADRRLRPPRRKRTAHWLVHVVSSAVGPGRRFPVCSHHRLDRPTGARGARPLCPGRWSRPVARRFRCWGTARTSAVACLAIGVHGAVMSGEAPAERRW